MHCHHCGRSLKIGQEQLTEREKRRFDWSGDPHGSPNIIEAQCVKAAATHFQVEDWIAYWDPELSVDENIEIMAKEGSRGPTMKDLRRQR